MEIVHDESALTRYIENAVQVSGTSPVLIDSATSRMPSRSMWMRFPTAPNVHVAGIMEHIEEAGIHSGDSACSLPPYSLDVELIKTSLNAARPRLWRWRSAWSG